MAVDLVEVVEIAAHFARRNAATGDRESFHARLGRRQQPKLRLSRSADLGFQRLVLCQESRVPRPHLELFVGGAAEREVDLRHQERQPRRRHFPDEDVLPEGRYHAALDESAYETKSENTADRGEQVPGEERDEDRCHQHHLQREKCDPQRFIAGRQGRRENREQRHQGEEDPALLNSRTQQRDGQQQSEGGLQHRIAGAFADQRQQRKAVEGAPEQVLVRAHAVSARPATAGRSAASSSHPAMAPPMRIDRATLVEFNFAGKQRVERGDLAAVALAQTAFAGPVSHAEEGAEKKKPIIRMTIMRIRSDPRSYPTSTAR